MRRAAPPPPPPLHPAIGPPHAHLPRPTGWPMVMAVGIVMILAGLAVSLAFSVGGAFVFVVALIGWIGELRHE